jgi:pimeloyl-ACP methyl ester carboxylesterase
MASVQELAKAKFAARLAPDFEGSDGMPNTAATTFPAFKTEAGRARYMAAYDAVLAAWQVPFEERDVATRAGPTHVIVSGPADAPPLVLLHSLAGTASVWRLNVEALSQRHRVYAVDVIGQPGKSVATRRLRGRRDYAGWFNDLLDGLGIERASIVGCSFGGFLALSQAILTPDRVERLVMISPAGSFVGLPLWFTVVMRTAPIRRRIRRLFGDRRAPGLADLGARTAPRDRLWARLMAETMAQSATISVTKAAVFSRRELRRVRAPSLLLIGDKERLYEPHATLALALKRMPGLTGAIVPDADHIAAMAQPEDVNARILAFLAGGDC